MNVILLEKIANLGELGDKVDVKSGFARNFLIPQGKAKPATKENIAEFEAKRAELEQFAADALADANKRKTAIEAANISIAVNAGEEGKMFGSVGTADIAEAATAAGVEVGKHEVRLPEGTLRELGDYEVMIHLHPDVDASLQLHLVADE